MRSSIRRRRCWPCARHLTGEAPLAPLASGVPLAADADPGRDADLADVRGQASAKRVLEIAAAGAHSLLMVGPPGTGKSMLAQRLPGLLPPLSEDEALDVAALASLAGRFCVGGLGRDGRFARRTTRRVAAALVGGGSNPRPGEISLAHHGVLFLDELPEWDRRVLEVLREPLEAGVIHISRAARQSTFPGRVPARRGDESLPLRLARARKRALSLHARPDRALPGPDLRTAARSHRPRDRRAGSPARGPVASHGAVRRLRADRDQPSRPRAHQCRAAAPGRAPAACANARLPPREVDVHCAPDAEGAALLAQAMTRLSLSARAYHRVLKVARTIADLAGDATVRSAHVAEAIGYRRFERP